MIPNSYTDKFLEKLKGGLPASTAFQRKEWARFLILHNIEIKSLTVLLDMEYKTASRFSWFLSEVGSIDSALLTKNLAYLYSIVDHVVYKEFKYSFPLYWLECGVPNEEQGRAVSFLFENLLSSKVNDTTKSRSLKVLIQLLSRHSGLSQELITVLRSQIQNSKGSYYKLVVKFLKKIEGMEV